MCNDIVFSDPATISTRFPRQTGGGCSDQDRRPASRPHASANGGQRQNRALEGN